jgi:hypothetical protein
MFNSERALMTRQGVNSNTLENIIIKKQSVFSGCSSGGGMIRLLILRRLIHHGVLSSDGAIGCSDSTSPDNVGACGGGAGGSINIQTSSFSGYGLISSKGGPGSNSMATGKQFGGGGGGGFLYLNEYNSSIKAQFSYVGALDVSGGLGGKYLTYSLHDIQGKVQISS